MIISRCHSDSKMHQPLSNETLNGLIGSECFVYTDDNVVFFPHSQNISRNQIKFLNDYNKIPEDITCTRTSENPTICVALLQIQGQKSAELPFNLINANFSETQSLIQGIQYQQKASVPIKKNLVIQKIPSPKTGK